MQFGEGCYRTRCHTNDYGFHLGAHFDDQQIVGDDEFVTLELEGVLLGSYTGGYLNPEEALISMEEVMLFGEPEVEDGDEEKGVDKDCVAYGPKHGTEEQGEYVLTHYDLLLIQFGAYRPTRKSILDDEEALEAIAAKLMVAAPRAQYRSRPNWATS